MIEKLLEYIVKQLVAIPDDVVISAVQHEDKNILHIKVNQQDRGKVIGKQGQTIKALRMLVRVVSPEHRKTEVDIVE